MKIEGYPFEVKIIGADGNSIAETNEGYVGLCHKEQYGILVINNSNVRASVNFEIDGVSLRDTFVIAANSCGIIETIPNSGKKFTFFAAGTPESERACLNNVSENNLGLLSATFNLEYHHVIRQGFFAHSDGGDVMRGGGNTMRGGQSSSFGAGGTGFSGKSDQIFASTHFNRDPSKPSVTINLRLVHDLNRGTQLDAYPLPGRAVSNIIPSPVPKRDFS